MTIRNGVDVEGILPSPAPISLNGCRAARATAKQSLRHGGAEARVGNSRVARQIVGAPPPRREASSGAVSPFYRPYYSCRPRSAKPGSVGWLLCAVSGLIRLSRSSYRYRAYRSYAYPYPPYRFYQGTRRIPMLIRRRTRPEPILRLSPPRTIRVPQGSPYPTPARIAVSNVTARIAVSSNAGSSIRQTPGVVPGYKRICQRCERSQARRHELGVHLRRGHLVDRQTSAPS